MSTDQPRQPEQPPEPAVTDRRSQTAEVQRVDEAYPEGLSSAGGSKASTTDHPASSLSADAPGGKAERPPGGLESAEQRNPGGQALRVAEAYPPDLSTTSDHQEVHTGRGARQIDQHEVPEKRDEPLTPGAVSDKSAGDIRDLADRRGLEPFGQPDQDGQARKWRDPETHVQRLRIDQGHVDPSTGKPFEDPRAAVPHVHAYDTEGKPILDADGNKHFPLRA